MAVNTPLKRQASSRFSMPWSAGTRMPSGTSTAFERGATLGLYHLAIIAEDPVDGWTFEPDDRIWKFGALDNIWTWSH